MCLDATKFVLFRVFTLTDTICPKTWARPLPENEKVNFRLTCVAHKPLCPEPPYCFHLINPKARAKMEGIVIKAY